LVGHVWVVEEQYHLIFQYHLLPHQVIVLDSFLR
jgi:hypothetical protein